MRFDAYYACKGKPALQRQGGLDPDLAEILTERMLFKHSERGVTIWTHDDHAAVVKMLIVAYFKRLYPDEFLQAAPVSVEFFDQWWTLERFHGLENDLDVVVDELPPEITSSFTSTGNELVDAWITDLKEGKRYKSPITVHLPTGFMVLWNQRFVGYIQDASWELPFLRGKWKPIKNVVTAEFLTELGTGRETEVVISDGPDLRGPVSIEGDRISIRMSFATRSDKGEAAIPEGNNVYGLITAPEGLEPVLRAVKQVVSDGRVYIYQSQFNGGETLKIRSGSADFESVQLDGGIQHLFNGAVEGSLEEVRCFVKVLSEALSRSGIIHSFEIYDDQELIQRIPE